MSIREQQAMIQLNRSEWEIVLHLASSWGFDSLKGIAELELQKLVSDPVEKCEIGKALSSKALMDTGIVALAVRKDMVSASEAARIGYDIAYKLQACREAGARIKENSTLAARMQTAISDTFGFDKSFIDEVTEYKALSGVAGRVAVAAPELGFAIYGMYLSGSQVLTEIDSSVQVILMKGWNTIVEIYLKL